MKTITLLLMAFLGLTQMTSPASAQTHKQHKPKNTISQIRHARRTNHTVRQITPDPKKSPGKHADNLSKNVNHEINRESKDVNHFFQGKKKH
ncbi:MAG TPA: hypothetical protein VKU00_10705 [Chthonomonadaceae bacterium]|nr:hypothetical protein [Chthonomonadaceae bacterium]